jgi:hypothetical protein
MTTLDEIGMQPLGPLTPQQRSILPALQPASAQAQQAAPPIRFDDATRNAFEDAAIKYNVPLDVLMAMSEREAEQRRRGAPTATEASEGTINGAEAEQNAVSLRRFMDAGLPVQEAILAHFAGKDRRNWGRAMADFG